MAYTNSIRQHSHCGGPYILESLVTIKKEKEGPDPSGWLPVRRSLAVDLDRRAFHIAPWLVPET